MIGPLRRLWTAVALAGLFALAGCTEAVSGSGRPDSAVLLLPTSPPSPTQDLPPNCPGGAQRPRISQLGEDDTLDVSPDGLPVNRTQTGKLTSKLVQSRYVVDHPDDGVKVATALIGLNWKQPGYGTFWSTGTPGAPGYRVELADVLEFDDVRSACRFLDVLAGIRKRLGPTPSRSAFPPGQQTWTKVFPNGVIGESYASTGRFVVVVLAFLPDLDQAARALNALMLQQYSRL